VARDAGREGFTGITDDKMPHPASFYFNRNIWLTFFRDPVGLPLLEHLGVDNVMYDTDFPRTESSWTTSFDTAVEMTSALSVQDATKVMADNARSEFRVEITA